MPQPTNPRPLRQDDLPQLARAADIAAKSARRTYMMRTAWRLGMTVAAAAFGVASLRFGDAPTDYAAVAAAAAFVIAMVIDVSELRSDTDAAWYRARALAESAKTLAWKWAVRGNPYAAVGQRDAVTLVDDLGTLRSDVTSSKLAPIVGDQVTDAMRALRDSGLEDRRIAYLAGRIEDQQKWYAHKATTSATAARRWRLTMIVLEAVGAIAMLLRATSSFRIAIGGVAAAVVSSAGAWLEAQQHDQLATAYSTTLVDLADATARLQAASDEDEWAAAVSDAEDAISREHTRWRASRSQP